MGFLVPVPWVQTPDTNKGRDAAASIFELLDSKPKIDSSSDEGAILATVRGDIELQHVSFKYVTRPDVQFFRLVLDNSLWKGTKIFVLDILLNVLLIQRINSQDKTDVFFG